MERRTIMKTNLIGGLVKKGLSMAKTNSPALLSALAAVGVVTTAVCAVKAAKKAEKRIDEALEEKRKQAMTKAEENGEAIPRDLLEKDVTLTKREIVKAAFPSFAPTLIMGALTILCIFGGLHASIRKQAALTAAYNISERALQDYEKKIPEILGEENAKKVKDAIEKDKVLKTPKDDTHVEVTATGNQLCFDTFTGRYFKSTATHIQKIVNDLNTEINRFNYASLNDFYTGVGLCPVEVGDMLGWSTESLIDISFGSQLTDDNEPVVTVSFTKRPIVDYDKFGF
jgi:hypothetical protein